MPLILGINHRRRSGVTVSGRFAIDCQALAIRAEAPGIFCNVCYVAILTRESTRTREPKIAAIDLGR